jgi:hypothetical protein
MFADVVVTPSSGVAFQWRSSTGGSCGNTQITGLTAPKWVKLIRSGNSFAAFYATTTGTPTISDWIPVGSAQTIAMSSTARVGLAVTSHNNGTLCTGTFTGVSVQAAPVVIQASYHYNTAPRYVSFAFSQDVSASFSLADVVVQRLDTTNATVIPTGYHAEGNTVKVLLPAALSDGNYQATLLADGISDSMGNKLVGDYLFNSADFFCLAGDADRDRKVDVADLGILASNWQATGKTFGEGDFNYDGTVNVSDLGILATNWQESLAGLAPARAPALESSSIHPRIALAPARPTSVRSQSATTQRSVWTLLAGDQEKSDT